jgi:hypothetical protein
MTTHRKLLGIIRDPTFWRTLVPQLALSGETRGLKARPLDTSEISSAEHKLREDGYFRIASIFDLRDMARLEGALAALTAAGWPALFVFLFDEPWLAYAELDRLLTGILGAPYQRLAAFWAWCLEKSTHASGWGPHRDHPRELPRESRGPQALTLWVAVTEATPDNGCMYVLPATRDPNYGRDLVQCDRATLHEVRALPATAGTVLGWDHRLLHWGGRASAAAASPRMSLSAEFQRSDVPLFGVALSDPVPSFEERLALVGKQLIAYQHMQQPSAQLLDIAEQLVQGHRT